MHYVPNNSEACKRMRVASATYHVASLRNHKGKGGSTTGSKLQKWVIDLNCCPTSSVKLQDFDHARVMAMADSNRFFNFNSSGVGGSAANVDFKSFKWRSRERRKLPRSPKYFSSRAHWTTSSISSLQTSAMSRDGRPRFFGAPVMSSTTGGLVTLFLAFGRAFAQQARKLTCRHGCK